MSNNEMDGLLTHPRFPRSNQYDPAWVLENEMGPNALWLTEWLCESMDLRPGMRVLDMGCGKGMSSVFLAREFGVQVFANDLWIDATDNWRRFEAAELADRIVPIHAEAHALPYAHDFFDAVVSVDSYQYYGTDDVYLDGFIRHLQPGGQIGIVVPGTVSDLEGRTPEHLRMPGGKPWWIPSLCGCFHTVDWWRRQWTQTELVDIETADVQEDGWKDWLRFLRACEKKDEGARPDPATEALALEADHGRTMCFVRMVARRRAGG